MVRLVLLILFALPVAARADHYDPAEYEKYARYNDYIPRPVSTQIRGFGAPAQPGRIYPFQDAQNLHYLKAQELNTNCWASAIQAAMYNIGIGHYSQRRVMQAAGENGLLPMGRAPGIVRKLLQENRAISVQYYRGALPKQNLQKVLRAGGKAIVGVVAPFGHMMTIDGIDKTGEYFILLDPAHGRKMWITWDYLVNQRRWHETTLLHRNQPPATPPNMYANQQPQYPQRSPQQPYRPSYGTAFQW